MLLEVSAYVLSCKFWLTVDFSGTVNSTVKVNWMQVRSMLNNSEHDVLVILDCCYAAVAGLHSYTELLAASSRESPAGSHPTENFTIALADILHNTGGRPMTVAQVHAELVRKAEEYSLEATPVHAELGVNLLGSICLARLGETSPNVCIPPNALDVQIVVKVFLQDVNIVPEFEAWDRFLRTAVPPNLRDMSIEIKPHSLVNTGSFMLQFSVPLAVFSVLRFQGPFRFVCVARSENLFLRRAPTQPQAVPEDTRAPTGILASLPVPQGHVNYRPRPPGNNDGRRC
jgi:hypothetical protein